MINFVECEKTGYPARTEENVKQSECTIAIAENFNSPGEKLTKSLCKKHGKLYIPVDYSKVNDTETIKAVADLLNSNNITSINGAGNGIYSLPDSQLHCSIKVGVFLGLLMSLTNRKITHVRSGGQTGIDEAFLFAAEGQYVPNITCLAPKDWLFRSKEHKNFSDKELFINRFNF